MNIIAIISKTDTYFKISEKTQIKISEKSLLNNLYVQTKKVFDVVYVATDNNKILQEVENFGGNAILLSKKHKTEVTNCCEAIERIEIIENKEFDVVINIFTEQALVNTEQLIELKNCFKQKNTEIATLIKPINNQSDIFNTTKPKVILNTQNEILYMSRTAIPFLKGQKEDKWVSKHLFYKHINIFGYRKDILFEINKLNSHILEKAENIEALRWLVNGYKIKVGITEHENVVIENVKDLEKVKQIGLL